MKICNIVPLKYNYLMYQQEYVMLLCHLSMTNKEYVEQAKNSKNYKIMDNSIIELGKSFDLINLIEEARKCKANEIILPDVFQNGKLTLELVKSSIQYLKENNLIGEFKLQAVCHGNTIEEFENSFRELNKIEEIDVIGIPKILSKTFGNRCNLYDIFKDTNKEIHLLGCWESFNELTVLPEEAFSKIRSLDTCLISLLSLRNKDIFNAERPIETIDFNETEVDVNNFNILNNQLTNWLNNK